VPPQDLVTGQVIGNRRRRPRCLVSDRSTSIGSQVRPCWVSTVT
jgi:hypothetical protein